MCDECPSALARDLDAAFPDFLVHHQDLVYGMALRLTHRPADAEDLAQEAFIRAYRALRGYEPERTRALRPRGWLVTIVANLARNRARRRQPLTSGLDVSPEAAAEDHMRPDQVADRRDTAAIWRRRLGSLPLPYGQAVALRHVEGLTYPEMAELLGRPVGTVKSDVHRGVRMLRELMIAEGVEPAAR